MAEKISPEKEQALIHDMRVGALHARKQAREDLILAHIGVVHILAKCLCKRFGCWQWRDELISEGYVALIKSADEFQPEKECRIATYAYRRIWSAMMNWLAKKWDDAKRHNSQQQADDDEGKKKELADLKVNLEADLVSGERNEQLRRAVYKLPEPKRTVVILRGLEGLSFNEIAERLDMPAETAKSHHHRALPLLRKWLGGPEKYLQGGKENV